jgi:hypothetical protein
VEYHSTWFLTWSVQPWVVTPRIWQVHGRCAQSFDLPRCVGVFYVSKLPRSASGPDGPPRRPDSAPVRRVRGRRAGGEYSKNIHRRPRRAPVVATMSPCRASQILSQVSVCGLSDPKTDGDRGPNAHTSLLSFDFSLCARAVRGQTFRAAGVGVWVCDVKQLTINGAAISTSMDPKEGDHVRFKHMRVETTGTVIKRSGTHIRVQPKDGGATLWKELSELLPLASAVNEASEVAELRRLFSSGPSSARANALSARGVQAQAAAKQTISERANRIGMPTPMAKPAVGPLQATPPEVKRHAQENAYLDGDDTNLDGIDDNIAVAAQAAQVKEAEARQGIDLRG